MSTLKCNNCHLVVDELLAYIQNKVSIANEVSLVQICASAFSREQIEIANSLLLEALPADLRTKTLRKGKGKENRLLHDIISVFKVTDPDVLPVFVARDLEKLPPITFDHLDVSKLLKDLMLVQAEIKSIKSSYATVEQLENFKKECLSGKLPSPPLSIMKVNMKRGGYFDSGPIGLSQLDDTIVTTPLEQSNYETSPREYNSNYRSIDLSKAEGSNSVQFQSTVSKHSTDDCVTRAERGIMRVGTESSGTSSESNGQLGATAQIRSYAGVAKVHNPNEGWTVVQKKSQKSKNRLIGKMGNFVVESDEKFRAADRKIPLFITNVHKDTVESDIIKYIENKTQESIVSLEKISIKRQCEHDAYKIFVSQSKLPLYLDENLWPQGIIFRRFVHFKLKPKLKSNETPITQVALRNLPIVNG
ncbi:uncharacterized protein LOC126967087 [Leptidea sinapis]|uniref:uncharacterized protein LOC126967087 n=1 Tax=Leptidea sinapis TaxID=189913 RepID=UPI0021C3200B|nr:uncharacterized protein LOC126967087 [Leptidea sinapis]